MLKNNLLKQFPIELTRWIHIEIANRLKTKNMIISLSSLQKIVQRMKECNILA